MLKTIWQENILSSFSSILFPNLIFYLSSSMCLFMQRMSSFKLPYYQHSMVPHNKKVQSFDFALGISVLSWHVFTARMRPFQVIRLPPTTQRYAAGVNWWLCRYECACVLVCLSRQSVCKGCHLPKDSCDKG